MERNAHQFHAFELALRRIPTTGTKFFAGIADLLPFDEITEALNRALKAVDFVGLGQRVGAFVTLVIRSWQEGPLGELIALSIEAGFEAGGLAACGVWTRLLSWLGSARCGAQFADATLTTIDGLMKGITGVVSKLLVYSVAAWTYMLDRFRYVGQAIWEGWKIAAAEAINFTVGLLEASLNGMIAAVRKPPSARWTWARSR